jgi:hypothetical protein
MLRLWPTVVNCQGFLRAFRIRQVQWSQRRGSLASGKVEFDAQRGDVAASRSRARRCPAELATFRGGRGHQKGDDDLLDTVYVRSGEGASTSHATVGDRLDNFGVLVPGLRLRAQAQLPGARRSFRSRSRPFAPVGLCTNVTTRCT